MISISLSTMNNHLKLLLYIACVALIFYFVQTKFNIFDISFPGNEVFQSKQVEQEKVEEKGNYVDIYNLEGNPIRVNTEIADEDYERKVGLSGRKYIGDYEGMLFIMDETGFTPFWMKDMFFDLDILFIDEQGFIVDIKEGVEACGADFCPNILGKSPFKYVLEVKSGFVNINKIGVGSSIVIQSGLN